MSSLKFAKVELKERTKTFHRCPCRLETLQIMLPEAYGVWERSECSEMREEVGSFQETIKKQLKKVFVW